MTPPRTLTPRRERGAAQYDAPRRPLPRVGQRIHYDTGFQETSWSGEVRAIVDGRIVVRMWSKVKKRWNYVIETDLFWQWRVWQPGPLPKRPDVVL